MAGFETAFAILGNNSEDIQIVYKELGGLGPMLRAMPAILRIVQTAQSHSTKSEDVVDAVKRVVYYNENTKAKVAAFQKAHGLVADGIVGDLTWAEVEKLIGGKHA